MFHHFVQRTLHLSHLHSDLIWPSSAILFLPVARGNQVIRHSWPDHLIAWSPSLKRLWKTVQMFGKIDTSSCWRLEGETSTLGRTSSRRTPLANEHATSSMNLTARNVSCLRHATLQLVLRALSSISLRRIALALSKTGTSVTLSRTTVGSKSRLALTLWQKNVKTSGMSLTENYAKADREGLCCALSRASLITSMQGTSNMKTAWTVWEATVVQIIACYIPTRTLTLRGKNKPWLTPHLHRLHRKRTLLFKQARRTQCPNDWLVYRRFRNYCTNVFWREQRHHMQRQIDLLNNESHSSHVWWKKAKQLFKISGGKENILDLGGNGVKASSDVAKAELRPSFLQSSARTHNDETAGCPFPLPRDHPTFAFTPI